MQTTLTTRDGMTAKLAGSLFRDRAAQFVGRLGWDLCVSPEGLETDAYDSRGTEYLLVHEGDRHVGSCRVRPVTEGTMLRDHFSAAFPEAAAFLEGQEKRVYELTRFCRAPSATPGEAREMLGLMADMLDEFRDARRLTGFLAVVYPEVSRFLTSIGVRLLRVSVSEIAGREAHLICIIHATRVERTLARRNAASAVRMAAAAPMVPDMAAA